MSAEAKLKEWLLNPAAFVLDNFQCTPDAWQKQALDKITGPGLHKLALQACAGPGKSALDAWVILWFMSLQASPNSYPRGAAISITKENLRDNLWAELHKWRERSEFIKSQFDINSESLYRKGKLGEQWFFSARSFSKTANVDEMGDALSGLHADRVLVVLDESGSMNPIMLKRERQAMTTARAYGLILQSGNPLTRDGCLFAVKDDPEWEKVIITGDPDDVNCSPRVDQEENRKAIAKWGRKDAWVMAYILGEFPIQSLNKLISEEEVRACLGRHLHPTQWTWSQRRIGIDVARFGDDRTVLFPRQGKAAFPCVVMRQQDGPAIAMRYSAAKTKFNSEQDTIDDTGGWASSVIDFSRMYGNPLIPVNMSQKADDPDRFFNKRAEVYWRAAEWVKSGGALPPIEELVAEASASQYTVERGRIKVEEKEQIKRRLKKSPDLWDAFCLTFSTIDSMTRGTRETSAVNPMRVDLASEWDQKSEINSGDLRVAIDDSFTGARI